MYECEAIFKSKYQRIRIFLDEEESPKKNNYYYWNTDKYLDEPDEELYLRGTDRKITEQQKKIDCG